MFQHWMLSSCQRIILYTENKVYAQPSERIVRIQALLAVPVCICMYDYVHERTQTDSCVLACNGTSYNLMDICTYV